MTRTDDDVAFDRMVKAGFTPKDRDYPGVLTKWECTCNICGGDAWVTLNNVSAIGNRACPGMCRERRKAEGKAATADRKAQRREEELVRQTEHWREKRKAQEPAAVKFMNQAGYIPQEPFPGSKDPWSCLHEVCRTVVTTRLCYIRKGKGCGECKKRATSDRFSLPEDEARRRLALTQFEAAGPYRGAAASWLMRCTRCGDISERPLHQAENIRLGCRKCFGEHRTARRLRLTGCIPTEHKNRWRRTCEDCARLFTADASVITGLRNCRSCRESAKAEEVAEARAVREHDRLIAAGFTKLPDGRWETTCGRCGTKMPRSLRSALWVLTAGSGGCPYCCTRGLNHAKPAWIYIAEQKESGVLKVGAANDPVKRFRSFRCAGWDICWYLGVDTGAQAWEVEQAVLAAVRSEGHLPAVTNEEMPHNGATETVPAGVYEAYELEGIAWDTAIP
ncbi:hypothetical protein [Streptomyces sp. AP-93]|uniref:hypothetical protein n=1 Tax=Streptomyces sp. AP-93 TaxID=2929048 RepID=UPI001FAEC41D|nr:hypothetical protein [Streptomyces sp. AP-93]MCJ0868118.1 hypothetical protein [Streptomyces sp. AP-93]